MKEIKEALNKTKDILCSWIEIFNIVKMSILPNWIYRFNVILIKIPAIFMALERLILKFMWKRKATRIVKRILKKEKQIGKTTKISIKAYYVATVIMKVGTDIGLNLDKWSRIEKPDIDPHKYDQMFFEKGIKTIQ